MSLIPYIFGNFAPLRDVLFGSELFPKELWNTPLEQRFLRSLSAPIGHLQSQLNEITQNLHIGEDGFHIKLDVEHFKPEEVAVKTVDNSIIIEAKHEERKDSECGYVMRQIVRRYDLPKGYKPEQVVTNLSSDGILEIKCPKPESIQDGPERNVPIQQTGPARLTSQKKDENKTEEAQTEKPQENIEVKPEEKTEEKPVEKAEEKLEEKPEVKPEEKPEEKAEEKPEEKQEEKVQM